MFRYVAFKTFYHIIVFLYVCITTILQAKQLPSCPLQILCKRIVPARLADCLHPLKEGQRVAWDSQLNIQMLPPSIVGNSTLMALSLREGLYYIGWEKLREKGLHVWGYREVLSLMSKGFSRCGLVMEVKRTTIWSQLSPSNMESMDYNSCGEAGPAEPSHQPCFLRKLDFFVPG